MLLGGVQLLLDCGVFRIELMFDEVAEIVVGGGNPWINRQRVLEKYEVLAPAPKA